MTKPIDPFSLSGKPIAKGPEGRPETAEEILRKLRSKAGLSSPQTQKGKPPASPSSETAASGVSAARNATVSPSGSAPKFAADAKAAPPSSHRNDSDNASDVDAMLMEGAATASTRSHLPVLVAVFLVSAIAGGTLAGMIFSSRLAPVAKDSTIGPATAERTVADNTAGAARPRPNETVIAPQRPATLALAPAASSPSVTRRPSPQANAADIPTVAGTQRSAGTDSHLVKDEARILPAGKAVAGDAATKLPAARASDRQTLPASGMPSIKALPAASGAAGTTAVVAIDGSPASAKQETATPANDELKALTDNVVAALAGLTQAAEAATEQQTGNVREALSALVERALAEGRSHDDVARLLEQALTDSGEAAVPAALRDASGKVDLRLLIASIVPMEAAHRASGADQDYVNQLVAEGERTIVIEEGTRTASKGRFYFRNGKRYTRIRPGDTLSRIAFEAYGDVLAYPVILRANPGRISIRRLKPGMEIEVPLRKDAALRDKGPVKLAPATRPPTRQAARRSPPRKTAAKARQPARTGSEAAPQPAAETQQGPRKYINFRSRFTGGAIPPAQETR